MSDFILWRCDIKSTAAATLIIVGAILILAPAIMDYLYQVNLAHLVARAVATSGVADRLSGGYRVFLIVFGAFMVFVGIGMGFTALDRGPRG